MRLGERIEQARRRMGLTQDQVGRELGVTGAAVQQWESGETQPRGHRLDALTQLLGVDAAWLLTGKGRDTPSGDAGERGRDALNSRMLVIEELDVRAGMSLGGAVQDADIEPVKARWQIPAVVIRPYSSAPEEAIKMITAVGDSNVPEFLPGDRVMVDTSDRVPSPPGFFAIWDGFGEVIKRLEMVPYSDPPVVRLLSANPAYEPRELRLDAVIINGRVLGKWKWT